MAATTRRRKSGSPPATLDPARPFGRGRARHGQPVLLGSRATASRSRGSTRRRPSRATSSSSSRATGCSSAARRSRRAAASGSRPSIRPPRSRSPRSRAPTSRTSTRRSAPRGGHSSATGATCPAASAPSTSSASRASSRSAAASSRCSRSLDSGKPIKESRDVDVPLAAAHFWYYAGWADKLEYAFPNRDPQAARRRGAGHPLELPAADARLEDRAGPRRGQHGRAQAGQLHAADRAALRRRVPPGGPAAGRRQHHHRARARSALRSSSIPTSTRSPSPARPPSARRSAAPSPAPTRR